MHFLLFLNIISSYKLYNNDNNNNTYFSRKQSFDIDFNIVKTVSVNECNFDILFIFCLFQYYEIFSFESNYGLD